MKAVRFSASALAVGIGVLIGGPAATQPSLQSCEQQELGDANCGILLVPEGNRSGRQIALDIVILRATGPRRAPDPLFVLQGGPGQASTQQADFYARTFAPLRSSRDIYLVDARGTGRSHSLHCTVGSGSEREFLPLDAVRTCRERLSRTVDLAAYTTRQTVSDLETVRRRFKLPPVNLYGTSYGTRLALEYMRLHPRSVRTATLSGVVPAQNDAPTDYGLFAQAAFDRYAAICRTTPSCASAFPDPVGDLSRARQAIASAYAAGKSTVSPGLFGELVRMQLYAPPRVGPLFRGLREAAGGNFGFWEERAKGLTSFWSPEALSLGTFLSVTCADFMPRVDLARARHRGLATFAGSYRAEQQAVACAAWRVPPTPANFSLPVRSRVPTLLFSGELDPVTPPAWGELARQTLPNARHVIFRNSGHGLGPASACGVVMMASLLKGAKADTVDSRCAGEVTLPLLAAE